MNEAVRVAEAAAAEARALATDPAAIREAYARERPVAAVLGELMCASCSDSFATAEVARSMTRRSGVSVACPLCRAPSKVVLPEEMHTSLSLGPTKRRRRSTDE
jgi:hypothetical protein